MRSRVWQADKAITAWDFLGEDGPPPPGTPARRALTARMREAFERAARVLAEEHAAVVSGDEAG
jgi:hypothetical protein